MLISTKLIRVTSVWQYCMRERLVYDVRYDKILGMLETFNKMHDTHTVYILNSGA